MSSIKRKPTENILAGLEGALLANPRQNFSQSSAQFTGIVRDRIHRKESRNCARRVVESGGGAELSGQGKRNDEDASKTSRATLFFLNFTSDPSPLSIVPSHLFCPPCCSDACTLGVEVGTAYRDHQEFSKNLKTESLSRIPDSLPVAAD
jgi:hypothetical protein